MSSIDGPDNLPSPPSLRGNSSDAGCGGGRCRHIRHLAKPSSHHHNLDIDARPSGGMVDTGYSRDLSWRQEDLRRRARVRARRRDEGSGSEIMEHVEKAKTKMMSVWNNMKYGWTLKMHQNFHGENPIWLLGNLYHCSTDDVDDDDHVDGSPSPPVSSTRVPMQSLSSVEAFHRDFTSRFWLTYRRQFPAIKDTDFTTDCGWGCMLRSGQMLLAQALTLHFLGRDWRLYNEQKPGEEAYHREIIRWFNDHFSDHSPFSIHKLVSVGHMLGKRAGDWYGPSSVAHIMREAVEESPKFNPVLANFCVYVAQDCTIYKQDVLDRCFSRSRHYSGSTSPGKSRSILILIPVRLGGEDLNPIYIPCLEAMLAEESCCGIIGGKPRHSLYFVGWQDKKLIYLDPHFCRDVVDTNSVNFSIESFHCMSPRKISASRMDPSCTIGFYCKDIQSFEEFCCNIQKLVRPPLQRCDYPMFIVAEGRGTDYTWFSSPVTTTTTTTTTSDSITDDSYVHLSISDVPPRLAADIGCRNIRVYDSEDDVFINVSIDEDVSEAPASPSQKKAADRARRGLQHSDDFVFL